MSADERRESVIAAALVEFAKGGLAGTSTETIAARAGISQPYLFRLFPRKKDLFIASLRRAFGRVESRMVQAAEGLSGRAALDSMAAAYTDLLADRDLLLCQMHTYAACGDPEVREAARGCYGHLWRTMEAVSGEDTDSLRMFFAMGMLCNVVAALDLPGLDEGWAQQIAGEGAAYKDEQPGAVPATVK